jgi:hypothetical protein
MSIFDAGDELDVLDGPPPASLRPAERNPGVFPATLIDGPAAGLGVQVAGGLTLRDHLAGLAMGGLLTSGFAAGNPFAAANVARAAYQVADAMLARRLEGGAG